MEVPDGMTRDAYEKWVQSEYYFNRNYCPNCGSDMRIAQPLIRGEYLDNMAKIHGLEREGRTDRELADAIIKVLAEAIR